MKETKVTTMKSMMSRPAGKISMKALRDLETIPSLGRRYLARRIYESSFNINYMRNKLL